MKYSEKKLKFQSDLFKKSYFFFPEKGMNIYKEKVIENSGKLIECLETFEMKKKSKVKKIFIIFKDGDLKSMEYVKSLKLSFKVQPISPRWIDWCLKSKFLLSNPVDGKFLHLLPFSVETPIENLKKFRIFFKKFATEKMNSYNESAKILGFGICLCESEADVIVIPKIKEKNKESNFKDERWFLGIISTGKAEGIHENNCKLPLKKIKEKKTN